MNQYLVNIIVVVLCNSPSLCWAEGSGCGSADLERLTQQRLENLLGNIQTQLGPLFDSGQNDTGTVEDPIIESPPVNESVIRMYEALLNSTVTTGTHVNREQDYCRDGEFYAQPVTSFEVEMSISELVYIVASMHAFNEIIASPHHTSFMHPEAPLLLHYDHMHYFLLYMQMKRL